MKSRFALRELAPTDFRAFVDYTRDFEKKPKYEGLAEPVLFQEFLHRLAKNRQGIELAPGNLRQQTYFVFDPQGEVLGRVDYRQELSESTLIEGGHVGYEIRISKRGTGLATQVLGHFLKTISAQQPRVLLTCNEDNFASERVIQKNGGVYESTLVSPRTGLATKRYWIDLSTTPEEQPLLETERLLIRKIAATDAEDLHEYLSLPETYLFEPGQPLTREQAAALAAEREHSDCFYAVVEKETGKMVGHLYFSQSDPPEFLTWELGYIFNPRYQRQGYCTEASQRILDYGFTVLSAHRIQAFCDPQNPASWRVLEKIGMQKEGVFKKKAFFRRDENGQPLWHDCLAYGILGEAYGK